MNAHLRMEKILAIIQANPGISGQKIAAMCAVPWSTIRNDLTTMLQATENPIPLYTDDDEEVGGTEENFEMEFTPQTKWYLETQVRGNVPLHLTLGEALEVMDLPYVEEKHAHLQSLKQKILSSLDLDHQGTYRYIKGDMAPAAGADGELLFQLEQAASRRRKISFAYKAKLCTAAPLGLIYYSRLRQWYLVALADGIYKTFSLSAMREIKEAESFRYPANFSLRDWLAPRWGMEFGELLPVKVRFLNRSQTIAKVRKDVAHRQCSLKEEDGGQTLLYEDTIIGKNEFLVWILGFGSAAEVLEPPELRAEVIARVRAALANYN